MLDLWRRHQATKAATSQPLMENPQRTQTLPRTHYLAGSDRRWATIEPHQHLDLLLDVPFPFRPTAMEGIESDWLGVDPPLDGLIVLGVWNGAEPLTVPESRIPLHILLNTAVQFGQFRQLGLATIVPGRRWRVLLDNTLDRVRQIRLVLSGREAIA